MLLIYLCLFEGQRICHTMNLEPSSDSTGLSNQAVNILEPEIEVFVFDKSEFSGHCDGSSKVTSNASTMKPVEDETVNSIRITDEHHREAIFVKQEIMLENEDDEGDCPRMTEEDTEFTCVDQEKPNIVIKSDPEFCNINNYVFCDIQPLTNTDEEKNCCEEKPLHCVKEEKITTDDDYLGNDEKAKGELKL